MGSPCYPPLKCIRVGKLRRCRWREKINSVAKLSIFLFSFNRTSIIMARCNACLFFKRAVSTARRVIIFPRLANTRNLFCAPILGTALSLLFYLRNRLNRFNYSKLISHIIGRAIIAYTDGGVAVYLPLKPTFQCPLSFQW